LRAVAAPLRITKPISIKPPSSNRLIRRTVQSANAASPEFHLHACGWSAVDGWLADANFKINVEAIRTSHPQFFHD
jgi:hypothetical protein